MNLAAGIQHTYFSYHFKTSKEKNGTYLSPKTQLDHHQNLIFASMGTGADTVWWGQQSFFISQVAEIRIMQP